MRAAGLVPSAGGVLRAVGVDHGRGHHRPEHVGREAEAARAAWGVRAVRHAGRGSFREAPGSLLAPKRVGDRQRSLGPGAAVTTVEPLPITTLLVAAADRPGAYLVSYVFSLLAAGADVLHCKQRAPSAELCQHS